MGRHTRRKGADSQHKKPYDVQKYDISRLGAVSGGCISLGGSGSGKSTVNCAIIGYNNQEFCDVLVISGSASNGDYDGFFPPDKIYDKDELDEECVKLLEDFYRNAQIRCKSNKELCALKKKSRRERWSDDKLDTELARILKGQRALCVLEDLSNTNNSFDLTILKMMFKKGRHIGLTVLLSLHNPKGIPLEMRSNYRWLFVLD